MKLSSGKLLLVLLLMIAGEVQAGDGFSRQDCEGFYRAMSFLSKPAAVISFDELFQELKGDLERVRSIIQIRVQCKALDSREYLLTDLVYNINELVLVSKEISSSTGFYGQYIQGIQNAIYEFLGKLPAKSEFNLRLHFFINGMVLSEMGMNMEESLKFVQSLKTLAHPNWAVRFEFQSMLGDMFSHLLNNHRVVGFGTPETTKWLNDWKNGETGWMEMFPNSNP